MDRELRRSPQSSPNVSALSSGAAAGLLAVSVSVFLAESAREWG